MKNTSVEYLISSLIVVVLGLFICFFTRILMITYDLSIGTAITFMMLIVLSVLAVVMIFWSIVIVVHDLLEGMMVFDHIRRFIYKHKK